MEEEKARVTLQEMRKKRDDLDYNIRVLLQNFIQETEGSVTITGIDIKVPRISPVDALVQVRVNTNIS